MKTNALRTVAVALGLSVCTIVQAQSIYTSPAQWNNFHPVSDKGTPKAAAKKAADKASKAKKQAAKELELPAPAAEIPAPTPEPAAMPMHTSDPVGVGCQNCPSTHHGHGAAYCAPAVRRPMKRWFGGGDLLFLTLENNDSRPLATGLGSHFNTSVADPGGTTGFDIGFGRYLRCGRWGLGVNYMLWDPDNAGDTKFAPAGTITAASAAYSEIDLNHGTLGNDTVANHVATSASGMYFKRDMRFQGIELNLFSFGLIGARRVAYAGCGNDSILGNFGSRIAQRLAHGRGFGGATGPLVRPSSGRIRIMTSHGFRWFQVEDFVERGFDIDGTLGFQTDDLYEKADVSNNLFGYQFGGQLTYCLSKRWNLNIGGKFGLYGNRAKLEHCVGTRTVLANLTGSPADVICNRYNDDATDTALATLGELDLGLGFRISNAWTIRGGYRLFGLTGVANAVESHPTTYASVYDAGRVRANDSFVLHGGYVGLDFNW